MTSTSDPAAQHPLLVTTEWLSDHLESNEFVLIDAGEPLAYRRAHIAGAAGVPHPYLKGDGSRLVMEAADFETLARGWGISNDTPVVIYDDNASLHAARVWWVFQRYGHSDTRVVDGGLNAWLDEGRRVTSVARRPSPGSFTAQPDDGTLCTIDQLRGIVTDASMQVWDTRTPEEWNGTAGRGNARAGHVPGAVHLEWRQLMQGPPARRFRPLDEIRASLVEAGIHPEAETVTY